MPYVDSDKDPAWDAVQRRLHEALEPFAADLGARTCAHGDWADCDANAGAGCLFGDTQPRAGSVPMIGDWVLVLTVADMGGSGNHDISSVAAPRQRQHVTDGLLHRALYD